MDPVDQLRQLASVPGEVSFDKKLARPLFAEDIQILQLNVGRRCNLTCKHCHVEAGPHRRELMDRSIFEKSLQILSENPISTIDITGGAPEMNPHLPWFISQASKLGRRLLVRSNLLILLEPEYRRFVDLYARHRVEVVTSLPDYIGQRTNRQRGEKVFERVVQVMQELNAIGYGREESGLTLNLVYNPTGAYLPGSQEALTVE